MSDLRNKKHQAKNESSPKRPTSSEAVKRGGNSRITRGRSQEDSDEVEGAELDEAQEAEANHSQEESFSEHQEERANEAEEEGDKCEHEPEDSLQAWRLNDVRGRPNAGEKNGEN